MKFYELKRSFFRKRVQIRRYFATKCTIRGTRGAKLQVDATFSGRSMVEMLGVLAIIGVLSVGAIAGYSKAMMKYKLNKQADQVNNLFSIMSQYRHEWKFDKLTSLTPYYIKMGLIPEDMVQSDGTLQDVFGSTITLRNNYAPSFSETAMLYQFLNNNSFEVCQNLYQNALSYSSELSYIAISNQESSSSTTTYSYKCYGDTYCSNPNLLCCKNLTLNDFAEACKVCDQKSSCYLTFVWDV